jgi:very-short-patch-repair endonuclease
MLTRHIRSEHDLTKKEYVIETEYDGEPPKCACGLCDKEPNFARGSFSEYAVGHDSHEWQEEKYVEKYGQPTCEYCGEEVGFRRGEPNKYCSQKCCGKDVGGFTQNETQEKIKRVCKEKYGVENPSELDEVKQKIGKQNKGNNPFADKTEEEMAAIKQKMSEASKEKWKNPDFYEKTVAGIAESLNDPSEMSKPHKKFRKQLNLDHRGYDSEQQVGRYIVDELNEEEMKVIEVFGDYVHANPKQFNAEDEITLTGSCYTAKEKWKHDRKKIEWLEEQGYEVTVLWASDTEEQAKEKVETL